MTSLPGAGNDREPFVAVQSRSRTRVIETTRLETNGDRWRAACTCGWRTPAYSRRKTAERHYNEHISSRPS